MSGYSYANAFDGAGNATTFRNDPHTYNDDNQLTGPAPYVYDGNGNPTTFGGTGLSFDVENRMTGYGTALTAGYRGDGLRAWKQPGGGNKTYFLYDGISVLCELDHTGAVSASSTYGANGLLSRGSVQYEFDPLGDAVLLLDGSGAVTATQGFDAWGNALVTATGPFGYRARFGYFADSETGLVALAFRYYAPGVGRFVNRDPIGERGGILLYAYVHNRACMGVDAAGLIAPVVGAAGLAFALCTILAAGCAAAALLAKEYAEGPEGQLLVGSLVGPGFVRPGQQGHNDAMDAVRHCAWICRTAQLGGDTCAARIADLKENYNLWSGDPYDESVMDWANNDVGLALGAQHPHVDCGQSCLSALLSGDLEMLWP